MKASSNRILRKGRALWGGVLLAVISTNLMSAELDTYLSKAEEYVSKKEYKAAVIELKNALQQEPGHAEARYLLGEVYIDLGNGASAEKELSRALELGVAAEKGMPLLGRAYLMQGKYREALAEIKLDESAPAEARAKVLVVHGDALLLQRSLEDAQKAYDSALGLVPELPDALLSMARLALSSKDIDKAVGYVDKVLFNNPDDVDGLVLEGEIFLRKAKHVEALKSFSQASRLRPQPQNLQALLGKAMAEVALQQYEPAAEDLNQILKAAPQHPIANYLQAVVYFQRKELGEAKDSLNKVLQVAPGHVQSQLLMGMTAYLLGELEQAEYQLNRFVAAVPTHVPGRKALAAVYLKLKQPQQAIEALDVISHGSSDAQLLALLGTAYLHNGDNEKGTENLQKAAELKPDMASIRAQLALGRLVSGENEAAVSDLEMAIDLDQGMPMADLLLVYSHLRSKQFDKAIAAAQGLVKKQPKSPVALNVLGVSFASAGNRAEAKAQFEKALQQDPKYAAAYMGLARLVLQEGNSEQASAYYQQLLKVDAKHLGAMLALARLADTAGDHDAALNWVKKARKANPKSIEPMLLLANAHLVQGESMKALAVARELHGNHPKHPLVLAMLGKAQLANDDTSSAVVSYKKLLELQPQSDQAVMLLAEAQVKNKQLKEAGATLETITKRNESAWQAFVLRVGIYIELREYDQARKIVQKIQTKSPDQSLGYELEGNIFLAEKNYPQADKSFSKAFSINQSAALAAKLHRVRASLEQKNSPESLEVWLSGHPDDWGIRLLLAMAYQADNKNERAIENYESVLKHQPDNVVSLNNITYILQSQGDERALRYAERVHKLAGNNPAVLDTVGWAYIHNGKLNDGLVLLQEARSKAPHTPEIAYHLAVALDKVERSDEAREELERLLRDKPSFEHEAQAYELLRRLQAEGG